ncbi:ketopantoate hydroxymethyltransferase [Paenibacillus sp. IB182496]|uniref:Ketopantoate hydroxymethyltransferase n=1 Tax=Paenibacillus sabuli TaxID=2772509 RepID=A0A927GSZ4_9BACL|nr:ketopantoate hydroxymethyltransferase [Paenibacillus sabuli]MBD2846182.1 ketopantoate hydroxymethyltransferase [Paenibacillus sabuli]
MIATNFLHDIADYVDHRVAKVVINGSYEITQFEVKSVTDQTLALNYVVPLAEVSQITLIELKDAENQVLTANSVDVPITADHLMVHTLSIKEVS